jgi:hypothetical protein
MTKSKKALPDDITHIVTCKDCREFHREMIQEDREETKNDFRTIVKEEWQCSLDTIERVSNLEKNQKWIIASISSAWGAIIYLIIKMIFK